MTDEVGAQDSPLIDYQPVPGRKVDIFWVGYTRRFGGPVGVCGAWYFVVALRHMRCLLDTARKRAS